MRLSKCVVAIFVLFALANGNASAQCTVTWTNTIGGDWATDSNWNTGTKPTASDDVCIIADAEYTVTLSSNQAINSLTFGSATGTTLQTFDVNATLTVAAPTVFEASSRIVWKIGGFAGGTTVTNNGLIVMQTAQYKDVSAGATLVNNTTLTWVSGWPRIWSDATIINNGFFDNQSNDNLYANGSGGRFVNSVGATFLKSVGAGEMLFPAALILENEGVVDAQTGSIALQAPSTHTDATLNAAAGASVRLTGGVHTIVGTLSGNPEGEVTLTGASLHADPSGASINFGAEGFVWEIGSVAGGDTGGGDLTNTGLIVWIGSQYKDVAGETTFINDATITWAGGWPRIGPGSVLLNNDLIDAQSDANLYSIGSDNVRFVNSETGVLRKSAGTADLQINSGITVENFGLIDAQVGIVRFTGPTTHTNATLYAAADALILLSGSTQTIVGTLSGTPDGSVQLSGATLQADLAGAVLDFGGTGFEWVVGPISGGDTGGGSITNVGLLVWHSSQYKDVTGETTFINEATITWIGGWPRIYGGSTLENRGFIDAQSDADFYSAGEGTSLFVNSVGATVQKTGGTANAQFNAGVTVENRGLIDAQVGGILFLGTTRHIDGTLNAAVDAIIGFNGGTQIIVGELLGSPQGRIYLNGATLRADSLGGSLNLGGTGFEWVVGSISSRVLGGGTISNDGLFTLTTSQYKDLIEGTTLQNNGTITWAGGWPRLSEGAVIDNRGTFELLTDADFYRSGVGTASFVNADGGLFRKSGGVASTEIPAEMVIENRNGAVMSIESGTVDVKGPFLNDDGGRIQGTASLKVTPSFNNRGIIAPGVLTGKLNTVGDLKIESSTSVLEIGLAGSMIDTTYDHLVVSGIATLGGTLDVNLIGAFEPEVNQQFTVLSAGTLSGQFGNADALTGLVTDDGLEFGVSYNANQVTLTYEGLSCTTQWTNGSGGNWSDSGNWSNGVPTTTDDACVVLEGTYLVSADVDVDVKALTIGGASGAQTLAVPAGRTLTTETPSTVRSRGVLAIADATLAIGSRLTNVGTVEIAGSATSELRIGTLFNSGAMSHVGGGLRLGFGGEIDNDIDGIYEITGAVTIEQNGDGTFRNRGVVRKTTDDGESTFRRVGGDSAPVLVNEAGGQIEIVTGTLNFAQAFDHQDGALISGVGTIVVPDNFAFAGDVSPGLSIGQLDWQGDYSPMSESDLLIELGPNGASDLLAITGTANLGGGLRLRVQEDYNPTVDDEFTFITADSFNGAFESLQAPEEAEVSLTGGGLRLKITEIHVGVEEIQDSADELRLDPGYPNPATSMVTLELTLPTSMPVDVRAYDLLGREVSVLQSENQPAGLHRVTWDVSNMATGQYFVRLSAGGKSITQQIVVIR